MLAEITRHGATPFAPETVNACVDRAAVESAATTAIRHYDASADLCGSMTFAELRYASCRLAGALAQRFRAGESIALWGNNGLDWVVCELAIMRMGGIVVTLDPGLRPQEVEYMLAASAAAGVLMDRSYRGIDLVETLSAVRERVPRLREHLFIDQWAALGAEPLTGDPSSPDDPALVVFTSGTTGKPKGVILHHAGVVGNARDAIERSGLSAKSALLNPLPAYSVGGAVCITLGALTTQRPQIIINHFDAGVVIDLAARERFGWMPLVPAMLIPLVAHPRFGDADLSGLESVWMGGTIITPEHVATARRALGVKVVTIYGQTESGGVHAMNLPDASPEAISATVGVPLSHGTIRIADLASGATLARGRVGEIRTKAPYRARGYFADPEATAALFDNDGWLRTGDLGLIDDDGLLQITGRLKEMIIRGGRNIYPREIEDALSAFPDILEVAVLGVPHPRWGEEVACAVRCAPGRTVDLDAARRFLEERLAGYKVPRLWRQVDDFPRGAQSKIRKIDLVGVFAVEQGVAADPA